jgi:hypothetical protein
MAAEKEIGAPLGLGHVRGFEPQSCLQARGREHYYRLPW